MIRKRRLTIFSSHLLQVRVYCIYFATGYEPEFIQRVLRMESDVWRTYVRDLVCTAIKVTLATNMADEMPIMYIVKIYSNINKIK